MHNLRRITAELQSALTTHDVLAVARHARHLEIVACGLHTESEAPAFARTRTVPDSPNAIRTHVLALECWDDEPTQPHVRILADEYSSAERSWFRAPIK
jgi:hypothetical protein